MSTIKRATTKKKAVKKTAKKATPKKAVKKVTKKATAKKVAKKSTKKVAKKTGSKTTKKSLVYAPDHESFWVTNGQILNSLVALRDALEEMEKEVYRFHTDKTQNDFANWVDAVLEDAVLCQSPSESQNTTVR